MTSDLIKSRGAAPFTSHNLECLAESKASGIHAGALFALHLQVISKINIEVLRLNGNGSTLQSLKSLARRRMEMAGQANRSIIRPFNLCNID